MARVIVDLRAVRRALERFCQANCGAGAGAGQFCVFRSMSQTPASDEAMEAGGSEPGAPEVLPSVRLHALDPVAERVTGGGYAAVTATFQITASAAVYEAHPAGFYLIEETISRLEKAIAGAVIADDDTADGGAGQHEIRLELSESGVDPPSPAGSGSERLPDGFALFVGSAQRTAGAGFESD